MKLTKVSFSFIIVIITILCGLGIYGLSLRPSLPVILKSLPDGLVTFEHPQNESFGIQAGLKIISVDDQLIKKFYELEEITDRKKIGHSISVQFDDGNKRKFQLIQKNDLNYILLNILITVGFLIIGILVWFKSKQKEEKYFAITSFLFGFIMAMGWPGTQLPRILSLPMVCLYFISYPQAFLSFLYFCYFFPSQTISNKALKKRKIFLLILGIFISLSLIILFFNKFFNYSPQTLDMYYIYYRIFRAFIFLTLFFALYTSIRNLRRDSNPVNRRKIQWVLWGIICGSFPFIFLWNLPQIFNIQPFIPEWIFVIFLLITPISIAVAIIRYHLFDIEVVISRTITYTLVLLALLTLYFTIIGILSLIIHRQFEIKGSPMMSLVSVIALAVLINPIKSKVQQFVDIKFFKIRYNRFQILQDYTNKLSHYTSRQQVLKMLSTFFQKSIPLEKNLLLLKSDDEWKLIYDHKRPDHSLTKWIKTSYLELPSNKIVVNRNRPNVETEIPFSSMNLPEPWIVLAPIGKNALWFLGKKRSGNRFWKDDLDLLDQMVKAACLQLDILEYIEFSMQQRFKKEQAEELNRWKDLILSDVAHDLRAPLNTMIWKLRNLQDDIKEGGKTADYTLSDIRNQIYRLQRFIESFLNLSTYEKGKSKISLETLNLQKQILEIQQQLQGIIKEKSLNIKINCDPSLKVISHETLLQEIILNVFQNAAKFSSQSANIQISASKQKNDYVLLTIEDEASGIPKDKLKIIYHPFSKIKKIEDSEKSFHLGLYLVQEFSKILKIKFSITSTRGKGTIVQLYIPAAQS